MTDSRCTWTLAWLILCLTATPVWAQEPVLTAEDGAAFAAFYNAPGTTRVSGAPRGAPDAGWDGNVAALGGPLVVAGVIRGDVLVINGDLEVTAGGRIEGDVILVGGDFSGTGVITGATTVYSQAMQFRLEGERLIPDEPDQGAVLGQSGRLGRWGLNLAVDGPYNRVEGLPISLGSRIELGRGNPTILDARLIWRTGNGLQIHPDELGHEVRIEQYIGGHRTFRVGVGWYRLIDPIEDRGLSTTEYSLATFVLHRDLLDHYVRWGWRTYLQYTARTRPMELGLEYRDETHGAVGARTPWALLNNDEPWRSQPWVAEGELQTVRGWLRWDTRNDREDPSTGWLLDVEVEQGVEGDLLEFRENVVAGSPLPVLEPRPVNSEFTTIRLDLRRYLRLGPRARLALRALAAGSPDDGSLPAQRQHALGGEGTLPGYGHFTFDCGASDQSLMDGFKPYYGCDRAVLLQAELRYAFMGGRGLSLGRLLGLDFELAANPELVFFADAGRSWIEPESLLDSPWDRAEAGPSDLIYDLGAGIRVGRFGFYLAAPLSGGGDGVNFFIRLGPRI